VKKSIIHTTKERWHRDVLEADGLVFVEFWRRLCPPCWAIEPTIETISEVYKDQLRVVKLNTSENPDLAFRYNIVHVPTFLFFKDGKEVDRIVGLVQRPQIKKRVDALLMKCNQGKFT